MKVIVIFIIASTSLLSQNKRDYIWFFGKDQESSTEGIQAMTFDFNKKPFSPSESNNGLQFDQNNSSICDEKGNLLFYTNGCAIANSNHQIMENGDSLNYGEFFQTLWRNDCRNGYPGKQDVIILTDPANQNGYYIIHKTMEIRDNDNPKSRVRYLKHTYVEMSSLDMEGYVTFKNKPFHKSEFLSSYLTAVQHKNKSDWWIVQPKRTNEELYIYLLDKEGISLKDSFLLEGVSFDENTSASGVAKFSPDGLSYAFFSYHNGLHILNFDRSKGAFSNLKSLNFNSDNALFSSLEFSPNSRYAYITNMDSLFQVDLKSANLKDEATLINIHDGVLDPLSTRYFLSTLGPDCKIYIRPSSSSNSMSVINDPNKKGIECDFVERGLQLPRISATGSFPNFPRFRVDEDEVCDPTISTFLGNDVYIRKELSIYPNPVSNYLNITIPDNLSGYIYVYDMMGREIIAPTTTDGLAFNKIDVSHLQSGYYTVEFIPNRSVDNYLYNEVFLKK